MGIRGRPGFVEAVTRVLRPSPPAPRSSAPLRLEADLPRESATPPARSSSGRISVAATSSEPVTQDHLPKVVAIDGDLAPGTMVGEYRVEAKVGQGGMGVVYGAVHPLLGKRAAIKVMRPLLLQGTEAVDRFVQEARALGRIGHPNIVDAFAFGSLPDGRCYFIMEWLQGRTLGPRVREGALPLDETLEIMEQMCRGLEAAHGQGIVHRDLKPDNVFLVEDSHRGDLLVKLLDFSIAKLVDDHEGRVPLTRAGVMMGTPAYVSPEQIRAGPIDARADIYALGVMLFEMLVGRLPFVPPEKLALLHMHLCEPAPMPSSLKPGVPRELDALLARMMAKQPEARPSLEEIRRVIALLRTAKPRGRSTIHPGIALGTGAGPASGRQPLHVYAAGVTAAAILAFATLSLSHDRKGPFRAEMLSPAAADSVSRPPASPAASTRPPGAAGSLDGVVDRLAARPSPSVLVAREAAASGDGAPPPLLPTVQVQPVTGEAARAAPPAPPPGDDEPAPTRKARRHRASEL